MADELVILQQDHCPVHTSAIVKRYLEDNNINSLDWPSISPDINPIENLWGHVKKQLAKRSDITNSVRLLQVVKEIWNDYNGDHRYVLENCIQSMPQRCHKLLLSHGGSIKY